MNSVPIKKLLITHPEYEYLWHTWTNIDIFREGGSAIMRNREFYLPPRLDELTEPELYQSRLSRFTYTPVMSNAIREFTAKLVSSQVFIPSTNDNQWDLFRKNWDGKNSSETQLLSSLFSTILYFGKAYCTVELPKLEVLPRSRAEADKILPYVIIHEPLSVVNWGKDWLLTQYLFTDTMPFEEPETKAVWTLYQNGLVSVYEAKVRVEDYVHTSGLRRTKITGVYLEGSWHSTTGDKLVPGTSYEIPGRTWLEASVDDEKWVGKSVYLKQKAHTLIENGWLEAGSIAGVVQRVYTPMDAPPMDDPRYTYEQPDYSELEKAGNKHILIGKSYQFVEAQGTAVETLGKQLDKIEKQIKELVSMRFASSDTSVLNQSGESKNVDMTLLNNTMKEYGRTVLKMYNNILETVGLLLGKTAPVANGLESYDTSTLDTMLDNQKVLGDIELPPTVAKLWLAKLSNLLVGTVSPEAQEQIDSELEAMFSPVDTNTEANTSFTEADLLGITPEEFQSL